MDDPFCHGSNQNLKEAKLSGAKRRLGLAEIGVREKVAPPKDGETDRL